MAIDTNELKELAEDLHVNGYNRYASAMSQAADELAKWEAVFGHLGNTPDECGNAIVAARDELEECCDELSADKDTWYRIVHALWAHEVFPNAQLAPSVPEGWLRAIDEALVTAHIGGADAHDTYEQAKSKLDNFIGLHVDIATDPAVNGGYKLVPIEPTPEMIRALIDGANQYASWNEGYRDMLAAAPKAKS